MGTQKQATANHDDHFECFHTTVQRIGSQVKCRKDVAYKMGSAIHWSFSISKTPCRAVATGPAGPVLAGPVFVRSRHHVLALNHYS